VKLPESATVPTLYFIGVTTGSSSIMKLFPMWAQALNLKNAVIRGIDLEIHTPAREYRDVVNFIKNDPLSLGALVTTHKIDIFQACRDLFDYLDPYAERFGELSSISKRDGKLDGYAKDPISSGLTMESFIPKRFFKEHGGEVLILGAGGSALAISAYLMKPERGEDIPSKVIITNRSQPRLDAARQKLRGINSKVQMEFHLCEQFEQNDRVLEMVKPYSLVVNATGLGKDRPGSPLTDAAKFPTQGLVWELNYRGDLKFVHQALVQKQAKQLRIEDGWTYFNHGWTQVIAEVFHIEIDSKRFENLKIIADTFR
jgi:shikimate dehydrogenase